MARKRKKNPSPQGERGENGENEKLEHEKMLVEVLKQIPAAMISTSPVFFYIMYELNSRAGRKIDADLAAGMMLLTVTESEVAEGAVLAALAAKLGWDTGLLKKIRSGTAGVFEYAVERYGKDVMEAARAGVPVSPEAF